MFRMSKDFSGYIPAQALQRPDFGQAAAINLSCTLVTVFIDVYGRVRNNSLRDYSPWDGGSQPSGTFQLISGFQCCCFWSTAKAGAPYIPNLTQFYPTNSGMREYNPYVIHRNYIPVFLTYAPTLYAPKRLLRRHLQEQEGYEVYDIFERGRERVPTQVRLWLEDWTLEKLAGEGGDEG